MSTTSLKYTSSIDQSTASGDYHKVIAIAENEHGEYSANASKYAKKKIGEAAERAMATEMGFARKGHSGGLDGLAQIARTDGVPITLRFKAVENMHDALSELIRKELKGDQDMIASIKKLDSLANDNLIPKPLKMHALDKVICVLDMWVYIRKKQADEMRTNHADFVAQRGIPDKKMNGKRLRC